MKTLGIETYRIWIKWYLETNSWKQMGYDSNLRNIKNNNNKPIERRQKLKIG